jgi:hypothetical protein
VLAATYRFALVDLRFDGMPPPRPELDRDPELDREATAKAFQRALPKIGLKLEPAMAAGMFLVIDHIEATNGELSFRISRITNSISSSIE